jgi:23S rRNA (adenine2503-C2)-methyltransferase
MGEPLDNVPEVVKAIGILTDPFGFAMGLQKVAVSTSGHLDGLDELLASFPKVPIAISLHAVNDRLRTQMMPINRRWNVAAIVAGIRRLNTEFKKPVLVQYTVIDGVNDSLEHAAELAALLKDLAVKINLIPLNEVEPARFRSPHPERLQAFKDFLHRQGLRVLVRYSKGQDISGACGQLVVNQ